MKKCLELLSLFLGICLVFSCKDHQNQAFGLTSTEPATGKKSIPQAVQEKLRQLGHNVQEVQSLGNAHGLTIRYNTQGKPFKFLGGSDIRGQGLAGGF